VGECVNEHALGLLLDSGRRITVVVEQLFLARVEHEAADHEVDADEGGPVRSPVEEAPLAHDREPLLLLGLHRSSSSNVVPVHLPPIGGWTQVCAASSAPSSDV